MWVRFSSQLKSIKSFQKSKGILGRTHCLVWIQYLLIILLNGQLCSNVAVNVWQFTRSRWCVNHLQPILLFIKVVYYLGQNYSSILQELKYLINWDKYYAQQHIICILYATYPILVYKVVNYISNYILHKKGIITGIALIMLTFTTEDLTTDCPI